MTWCGDDALRRLKALEAPGYDRGTRTLRVRFRSGGLTDYLDVAPEVFDAVWLSAHPCTGVGVG